MAAFEVVELPPPTPSSWRGSPDPKAETRISSSDPACSISGSTSTELNSQHLLVPPSSTCHAVNTSSDTFRSLLSKMLLEFNIRGSSAVM